MEPCRASTAMSTTLIGITDAAVESSTAWDVNKIGGHPDVMMKLPTPICERCRTVMVHIIQIYCPLELSPFHRVLHIFACVSKSCWNKSDGWKVYRSQLKDNTSKSSTHGTITKDNATMDTSDWCDDADDWGSDNDSSDNLVVMVTDNDATAQSDISTVKQTNPNVSAQTDQDHVESVDGENIENNVVSQLEELDIAEEQEEAEVQEEVVQKEECLGPDQRSLENVLSYLSTKESAEEMATNVACPESLCKTSCSDILKPFYLNVFDEPTKDIEDSRHVTKLLKDYERREHVDVAAMADYDGSSGGSGKAEKYEKSELKHGDRYFHKFMKCLSLCPQQVIRYQYGGTPLLISHPSGEMAPPPCSTCRAPRLFELQLVPPLVPYLRYSETSDPAVEFGTVIVYTCSQSCWLEDSPVPREEFVIVQSDPDQHLFKV